MSTVRQQDPLDELVVDARSVDRDRLAQALKSWARIDPGENLIRFLPGAKDEATIKQLTLVALLAQKAIHLLKDEEEEGLTPSELAHCTGAKGSSLRPELKKLADGGIVLKNSGGRYVVPAHSFDRVVAMLEGHDA